MENQPVTDLSYLRKIAMGDTNIMIETTNTFMDDLPHSLERIQKYYDSHSWKQLYEEAHKIKPNLTYMGMDRAHRLILDIEKQAKTKNITEELGHNVDQFVGLSQQALSELSEKLNQLKME